MLRNILLAVDDSSSGKSAQHLAIELALCHGASIAGLGIIDSPWYTGLIPAPDGREASDPFTRAEVRRVRARVDEAIEGFNQLASVSGVKYSVSEREGMPEQIMEECTVSRDLVVIGRHAYQHLYVGSNAPSETTNALVRDSPRPILVAPDVTTSLSHMVVAFDGSMPASRSLHLFCLLGLHVGREVQLLTVSEAREAAERTSSQAAALLAAHGAVNVVQTALASSVHPADILMSQSQASGAGGIVMGAYGHQRLLDRLFGSTTRRLLRESSAALFIHA